MSFGSFKNVSYHLLTNYIYIYIYIYIYALWGVTHLPPITKTIQVKWTRHAGHCWRSRDKLISDVLLWTPTYGWAKAGQPARTYIQQLCEDMGCSPEDLPVAMNNREKWWERIRDIRANGTTWWWWWYICRLIGQVGRVFTNGLRDRGSIPGHVIPKTLKMVLDTALLNSAI